ncbi:hypothetical protein LR48_Vigan232s001300 [Vigna angularis]|uniref:Wall-associated receptor kinase C-terminal domain-containing protein n=1 Tax=Phaseolus angularis TaxID=3914 RepID=A0A0L9T707_PHAAN|nr:hypothetical protein LR48_Vigan232s001300 [Vigna angularis]
MDEKHSHIHTTPYAFALTLSFLLLIALPYSHSQPPPPPCAEQSYMCSINVSDILDPVWKQIPPSLCIGTDPLPQLSCSDPYESQNFTLKKVNYITDTMTVVPTHTVNVCSSDFFHIYDNLKNSLLQHYKSLFNVTVFFDGCPLDIPNFPSERRFKCGDAVYYFREEGEQFYIHPSLEYCKKSLLVPIAASLDDYDNKDGGAEVLKEALRDGFQVSYSLPQDCSRCNQSIRNCWSGGYEGHVVSCNYYCPNQYCSSKSSGMSSLLSYILHIIATKSSF